MNCPQCKTGKIEATTKVYLDIETEAPKDEAIEEVVVTDMRVPLNLESELTVSCADCGTELIAVLADDLMQRVGPQPVGNAERTFGQRGGM